MAPDQNAVHICVATGTGIAPFRSFWRRCFFEEVAGFKFTGLFWLFMGAANDDGKLYDDEISAMLATYPDQFRVDYALSRVQKNKSGGKMYIQDKMEEYADGAPASHSAAYQLDAHCLIFSLCPLCCRDLRPPGERRPHLLLRPQGNDAGHPGHA